MNYFTIFGFITVVAVVAVLFYMDMVRKSIVPGFKIPDNGNEWSIENMSGKETLDSCRKWAFENGIPMFGYRKNTHPEIKYKNTCFGYKNVQPFSGYPDDAVHVTGCTDISKTPGSGCK